MMHEAAGEKMRGESDSSVRQETGAERCFQQHGRTSEINHHEIVSRK